MAKLNRSASIDFMFPIRSVVFSQDINCRRLKKYNSCPNIFELETAIRQTENNHVEADEWETLVTSMIDTCIKKKNDEIQKVELQVMCLEDLQTHYSKQMDMVIAKNRSLANELRYSLNALKSTNLMLTNEKKRQQTLRDNLNVSESLYNDLLTKNDILFKDIRNFKIKNNITTDEQEILQDHFNLYCSKNNALEKVLDEKKNLIDEKYRLQSVFKSTKIKWERDLKIASDDVEINKDELKKVQNSYKSIRCEIKQIKENIKQLQTDHNNHIEDHNNIKNSIKNHEHNIKIKSRIKTIIAETIINILEELFSYRFC